MQHSDKKVWYLLEPRAVKGPMTLNELPADDSIKVWRPGLREWTPTSLVEIQNNPDLNPPEELASDYFYVRDNGYDRGPYSTFEICERLNKKQLDTSIKIWTVGLKHWRPLFEYPELIERWQITRRKAMRVPLASPVVVTDPQGGKWKASALTVSESGLGIKGFSGEAGAFYRIKIVTPYLALPLILKTKLIYSQNSFSGFKLTSKTPEVDFVLKKYVNQFVISEEPAA